MRVLAIAASLVVGLVGFLMVMAFWFDTTAVTVKFVNDTKLYVALPDCSTDIAEIAAGSTARLPVASDTPRECHIDDAMRGTTVGCITLPRVILPSSVVLLSSRHRCD